MENTKLNWLNSTNSNVNLNHAIDILGDMHRLACLRMESKLAVPSVALIELWFTVIDLIKDHINFQKYAEDLVKIEMKIVKEPKPYLDLIQEAEDILVKMRRNILQSRLTFPSLDHKIDVDSKEISDFVDRMMEKHYGSRTTTVVSDSNMYEVRPLGDDEIIIVTKDVSFSSKVKKFIKNLF